MYDKNNVGTSVYLDQLTGVNSARDSWVSGFSKINTINNSKRLVENYSKELERLNNVVDPKDRLEKVNKNKDFISWTRGLSKKFSAGKHLKIDTDKTIQYMHRPFTKKWLVFDREIMEMPSRYYSIVGKTGMNIYIQGQGMNKPFSAIMTNFIPSLQLIGNGKGFPIYKGEDSLGRIDNISDSFKNKTQLSSEEVVFYVYSMLNNPAFLERYASDLNKAFPRIPILKYTEKYVEIGRKLADLHLNYENQPVWDGVEVEITKPDFRVEKMKHPKKGILNTIIYNNSITIKNIPEQAYEYVVNGRPAIEWIIDQYQVKTEKNSGITDDPNDFSDDPKYILNLLLSVITVSMRTIELIEELPEFEIQE